jgi:Zn ribbon nucleic-acid-binding protein
MEECPACNKDNNLDMSLEALVELTGSIENACAINKPLPIISWSFV